MTLEGPPLSIEATIRFTDDQAVLNVLGEVDVTTARELGALLEAATDRRRNVVLDLAHLDFMDASGISVLVRFAERLRMSDGSLTCRSPSPLLARVLNIVGLMDILHVQVPMAMPEDDHDPSRPMSRLTGLTEGLRTAATFAVDDDVIDGALRVVVAIATATVEAADGASVSLWRSGRLATVAASNDTVLEMDYHQYDTGEGPCREASIDGLRHHLAAVNEEGRWPAFTPKARELGINAILSSPLHAGEQPIGALNLYSQSAESFSGEEQELVEIIATETSALLAHSGVGTTGQQLAQRLADALGTRQVIAQAEGIMMQRANLSADDAYTFLRSHAYRSEISLREAAVEVVASTRAKLPPSDKASAPDA